MGIKFKDMMIKSKKIFYDGKIETLSRESFSLQEIMRMIDAKTLIATTTREGGMMFYSKERDNKSLNVEASKLANTHVFGEALIFDNVKVAICNVDFTKIKNFFNTSAPDKKDMYYGMQDGELIYARYEDFTADDYLCFASMEHLKHYLVCFGMRKAISNVEVTNCIQLDKNPLKSF